MKNIIIIMLMLVWAPAGILTCPQWDESLLPEECRGTTSFNCLPRCGKYPGDKPDIGAYEWFPGITQEKPWGDWNGVPLEKNPLEVLPPSNLRIDGG